MFISISQDNQVKHVVPSTAKVMSLQALKRYTTQDRISKASDMSIIGFRVTKSANGGKAATAFVQSQNDPSKKYVVFIAGADANEDISSQKSVFVTCNCDDYKYRFEYPNTLNGASAIINSNGEPTFNRNPTFRPGLCKHLVAFAEYLVRNSV